MSSVTATHLIMFIGSLVIASAVAGTVVMEVNQVSDSIETRGSAVAEEIETDIAIISDESQSDAIVNQTNETATVLVKNIGDRDVPAHPSYVDVLVDGSYDPVTSVERVDADSNRWAPGGVVEVTASFGDQTVHNDTEITVIVNGNEDSIDIYV
ncbi:archaellum stator protein ArlG [Halopiger thermotolerans]